MLDITTIVKSVGDFSYILLFLIVFFESFPFAFFLPGDSLLFTVGFLASVMVLNFNILIFVLFLAAVMGFTASFFFGKWVRELIYSEKEFFWLKKSHLSKTKHFYDKYGSKTIIIGRFVPIVRSFAATLAGAVDMDIKSFTKYNVIGGIFWSLGVTSFGFHLGRLFPNAKEYITPIVLIIIFVSILPALFEYIKHKKEIKKQI